MKEGSHSKNDVNKVCVQAWCLSSYPDVLVLGHSCTDFSIA